MRTQLRALLRAAGGRELRVMFPMVTDLDEMRQARDLVSREFKHQTRFGHVMPRRLQIGAMIEVPSLLYQLDDLMQLVDFVSVGSNDLFQFFCAVDRGNAQISSRFDDLSLPFLRALADIVAAGERNGVAVTLCGEMAGRPLSAIALLAMGFRSISMTSSAIGPVKAAILELDLAPLRARIDAFAADRFRRGTLRELLEGFAAENGIPY